MATYSMCEYVTNKKRSNAEDIADQVVVDDGIDPLGFNKLPCVLCGSHKVLRPIKLGSTSL